MESIKLKVQERAFPSRGRARIHETHMKALGIKEGESVEISAGGDKKPVVVTIFADTLVEEGYIRLSPEDIAAAGAIPGMEVTVTRVPPIGERVKKSTEKTKENVKEDVKKAKETISKKASSTKESVEKGVESVKKNLKERDL
jgi:formylmethanofuran dehydrogenase subunit D